MYAIIKAQLAKSVPFAKHAMNDIQEIGDGFAQVKLPDEAALKNHINTMHAGAMFTAGETASGAAMTGVFAMNILNLIPVATQANISYQRPAKTAVVADAKVSVAPDELRATLKADGKVGFTVAVELRDEAEVTVATMQVDWLVRTKK